MAAMRFLFLRVWQRLDPRSGPLLRRPQQGAAQGKTLGCAMMSEEENGGPAPELNRSCETLQVSGYPLPHRATDFTLQTGSYHFLKNSHSRELKGYTRKCEDS